MKKLLTLLVFLSTQSVFAHIPAQSSLSQLEMAHYEDSITKQKGHIRKKTTTAEHSHILILFFSNQCPHCIKFAPLLKEYVAVNHWDIEAISLNGESLPEFPNAIFATQEMIDVAYQGKPVVYPALFMANPKTKALYPISFGALSYPELQERINAIQAKVAEYEESHP